MATAVSATTRDAILRAAASRFASTGYRATTMQTIATAAGFTTPTLYAHFGSKRGILDALVLGLTADLGAVLSRPLPEGLSLSQDLELRVRDMLGLAERQRDLFALFLIRPYDLPAMDGEADEHEHMREFWESLFRAHVDELGDRTPSEAGLVVQGVLYSWVATWLRGSEPTISDQARRIVDLALRGLAHP